MNLDNIFRTSVKVSVPFMVLGFFLGLITRETTNDSLLYWVEFLESVVQIWILIMQYLILPMIFFQLLLVITQQYNLGLGRMGYQLFGIFILLILVSAIVGVMGGYLLTPMLPDSLIIDDSIKVFSEDTIEKPKIFQKGFWVWFKGYLLSSPINAMYQSSFIPFILLSFSIGIVIRFSFSESREKVANYCKIAFSKSFHLLKIILIFLPVGVFILSHMFSRKLGLKVTYLLAYFTLAEVFLLIIYLILMYLLMKYFSGFSFKKIQRGLAASQLIAFTSRSSLASLPSLLQGAKNELGIPDSISSLSLPLSASVVKFNRPITGVFKFIFVMVLSGMGFQWAMIMGFTLFVILSIPTSQGVPDHGATHNFLPMYVYYNVSVDSYLLLKSVSGIIDLFATVVNTTGYMASTLILFGINKKSFSEEHEPQMKDKVFKE